MVDGDTSASPLATARHRLDEEGGPGVVEQEAARPVVDGGAHVVVEVEGGDDHHRDRVLNARAGKLAGRLQAVEPGHADVAQAHVRSQVPAEPHRPHAGGRLADHLDPVGLQDEAEA